MIIISVEPEEGKFALKVNGETVGLSKSDGDARFHMYALQRALEAEYNRGYEDGEDAERRFCESLYDLK